MYIGISRFFSTTTKNIIGYGAGKVDIKFIGGAAKLIFSNPYKKNTLTLKIVKEATKFLEDFKKGVYNSSNIKELIIEFDIASKDIACAGSYLPELMLPDDLDPLHDNSPFVLLSQTLGNLDLVPTKAIIDRSLIGAGVELALKCKQVVWQYPDTTTIFLPHLRIGVPYHTSGLFTLLDFLGPCMLTRLMIVNRAVSVKRILEERKSAESLTEGDEMALEVEKSIHQLEMISQGIAVEYDTEYHIVNNRTGNLQELCKALQRQISLYHKFPLLKEAPKEELEIINNLRKLACTERLKESVKRHGDLPKDLNNSALSSFSLCNRK
ncbi:hypothetical protein [Rickettsiella endosymbiont of Rhagonycha lignosa]|uniref:hypothetical protein n=1 Tax=Rickettsiella endosymbiont of Rhagonycha lignosa TaxID=3077937 RepID=UPI00313B7C81